MTTALTHSLSGALAGAAASVRPTAPAAAPAPVMSEVEILRAQLAAAQGEVAAATKRAEEATAAAAAAVKPTRGLSLKAGEKGGISFSGMTSKFPVTLYAQQLERFIEFIAGENVVGYLRNPETAKLLEVRLPDGKGGVVAARGTAESIAECARIAGVIEALTRKA